MQTEILGIHCTSPSDTVLLSIMSATFSLRLLLRAWGGFFSSDKTHPGKRNQGARDSYISAEHPFAVDHCYGRTMSFQPPYLLELAGISPREQASAVGRHSSDAGMEGALRAAVGKEQGVGPRAGCSLRRVLTSAHLTSLHKAILHGRVCFQMGWS